MSLMSATEDTSHEDMSWLKALLSNIPFIEVADDVFQLDISESKIGLSENVPMKSIADETSHDERSPLKLV